MLLLGTWACSGADTAVSEPDTQTSAVDKGENADTQLQGNEVTIVTNMGSITIVLNTEKAPLSSENFLSYVDDGFYDGDDGLGATTFHRVISGFMIQGGGLKEDGETKATKAPVINESTNGLLNLRGTVAMARTNDPDSATSQFFINHVDNGFLDYTGPDHVGYAVFAEVIEGMDVVDAIAAVQTNSEDVPLAPVIIQDVLR
jgi:cyclophilin family peptidyl-prolyl cis-trans isomerase